MNNTAKNLFFTTVNEVTILMFLMAGEICLRQFFLKIPELQNLDFKFLNPFQKYNIIYSHDLCTEHTQYSNGPKLLTF